MKTSKTIFKKIPSLKSFSPSVLKSSRDIETTWKSLKDVKKLLLFKILCAGPQNKTYKKNISRKIKKIFHEIIMLMKKDSENLPDWMGSFLVEEAINHVDRTEWDILDLLDKEEWGEKYIDSLVYIDEIFSEDPWDVLSFRLRIGYIVKQHLDSPTLEDVNLLQY